MSRSSLRVWLFLLSMLFAVVSVAGISLVTYVVVTRGVAQRADETLKHLTELTDVVVQQQVDGAVDLASQNAVEAGNLGEEADRIFVDRMRERFKIRGVAQSELVLYDDELRPYWATADRGLVEGATPARRRALATGTRVFTEMSHAVSLRGLFSAIRFGPDIAHVPIRMPSGRPALLDIVYFPEQEVAIIDSVRGPMITLAIVAVIVMVAMMQTSISWVLRLVNELRQAADAIDAGRLDVRLPEQGNNEVGDLARSINRLIERLRRRAEVQTRFVTDASHELATPVAGIRGYTNILRAWGAEDAEIRAEAVNAIDRESRRMARLTGNLLTLVRSEQALDTRAVRFDLNMSCREVLAVAATRYAEKSQRFVGPDEGPLTMVGDPDRTGDVISILVDNAAKYTPPRGRVSLTTRRKRDQIVIEVADTGPGIPAADLPNIFERFYRGDASRSRGTGGFGLGLAIAKSLTLELHGSIEVESELGRGTVFTVQLPRGRP